MDRADLELFKVRDAARRAGTLYDRPLPLTGPNLGLILDQIRHEVLAPRQALADADPVNPRFDACYGGHPPRRMRAPGGSARRRLRAKCSGPKGAP